ncbi:MAG: hypothetical protein CMC65_07930 [Flavobacteriaceae bacterium]|nr:hypothetical protein [Flavobacteriaceae bacterium]|tara:strand:- start:8960 stop:11209 length:2250 start_codon:yes stop_codon:yes gene_type:complete
MAKVNDLLIVEMSSSQLSVASTENKEYILEGIFGEIDTKNKNNRIYTEDEYVPQIQALQDKIKSSKLLGELDHPQQFDISLKSVSHIIEELYYDKDSKHVKGKIRLLDTDAGRQAKALVDAGVPLQISSRAAGAVESNGKVKIKQLFTYDLVADPGFANAELKRVNESYGFDNNSGLWIYEMNEESGVAEKEITTTNINTEIKEKNMAEFVKAEDFNKYSEYLANEMKSIKESIGAKNEDNTLEDVTSHNDHIVESVNTLSEYVEYLAGKLDESIQYSEHVAEKADQGISYTETIAEKLDQGIQYSEHLAEAVGKVKDFANYVAEQANEGTKTNENLLGYVEYLKENLQQVSEYTEYIATQINENLVEEEVEDESGEPAEELEDETVKSDAEVKDEVDAAEVGELPAEDEGEDGAKEVAEEEVAEEDEAGEGADEVVEDEEAEEVNENPAAALAAIELAKELEDSKEESKETPEVTEEEDEEFHGEAEEVTEEEDEAEAPGAEKEEAEGGEEVGDNSKEGDVDPAAEDGAGQPAEELEDETVKSDAEIEDETEEAEAGESEEETEGEDGAHDPLESYKKEISSKLDALVESAQVKENENPAFLNVVSGSVQEAYNALNEDAKTEVRGRVTKRAFMNESQISAIIENANAVVEAKNNEPLFMTAIPAEYKEKFESLTEGKQAQIKAQANYHTLKTEYQVRNFWETRDLREVKVDLEKLAAVNESTVVEEADKPLYDVSDYAEGLKKRFKK